MAWQTQLVHIMSNRDRRGRAKEKKNKHHKKNAHTQKCQNNRHKKEWVIAFDLDSIYQSLTLVYDFIRSHWIPVGIFLANHVCAFETRHLQFSQSLVTAMADWSNKTAPFLIVCADCLTYLNENCPFEMSFIWISSSQLNDTRNWTVIYHMCTICAQIIFNKPEAHKWCETFRRKIHIYCFCICLVRFENNQKNLLSGYAYVFVVKHDIQVVAVLLIVYFTNNFPWVSPHFTCVFNLNRKPRNYTPFKRRAKFVVQPIFKLITIEKKSKCKSFYRSPFTFSLELKKNGLNSKYKQRKKKRFLMQLFQHCNPKRKKCFFCSSKC